MINVLILIMLSVFCACSEEDRQDQDIAPNPDTNIQGTPGSPETQDDPLKQLQDEGKLPASGGGGKMPVLPEQRPGPAGSSLNVFPPNVDPDGDNVPSIEISGHPEIKVDNCPNVFNPTQEDRDGDGVGDSCQVTTTLQ